MFGKGKCTLGIGDLLTLNSCDIVETPVIHQLQTQESQVLVLLLLLALSVTVDEPLWGSKFLVVIGFNSLPSPTP